MKQNIVITEPPKLVRDWEGHHVMSLRSFSTIYLNFPERTIFKVMSTSGLKHLASLPCECCGISGNMRIKGSRRDFLMDFYFIELSPTAGKETR